MSNKEKETVGRIIEQQKNIDFYRHEVERAVKEYAAALYPEFALEDITLNCQKLNGLAKDIAEVTLHFVCFRLQ